MQINENALLFTCISFVVHCVGRPFWNKKVKSENNIYFVTLNWFHSIALSTCYILLKRYKCVLTLPLPEILRMRSDIVWLTYFHWTCAEKLTVFHKKEKKISRKTFSRIEKELNVIVVLSKTRSGNGELVHWKVSFLYICFTLKKKMTMEEIKLRVYNFQRCSHVNWKSTDTWSLTCFKIILKILHSNNLWFCSTLPVKCAIFLKSTLLLNSFMTVVPTI